MESILTKAVKKAKMYGLPMIVYMNETNNLDYCSLDVFDSRYYRAIYILYCQTVLLRKLVLQTYTTDNNLAGVKSSQFFYKFFLTFILCYGTIFIVKQTGKQKEEKYELLRTI